MKLDKRFFQITHKIKTPFMVFDMDQIKKNYKEMVDSFPDTEIHYSMKSNSLDSVISLFHKLGSGFEVASLKETKQLIDHGIAPQKIICMHPIKSPEFLRFLHQQKIEVMAVDSYEEVDKIAKYAPSAKLVVRVTVDNEGSKWNLNGKFGLEVTEFPKILTYIQSKGLIAYGLMFHVGSQCVNEANWIKALRICNDIWDEALEAGVKLNFLSLGGGVPVKYRRSVPSMGKIGELVTKEIKRNFKTKKKLELVIEPGRSLVANSAVLVTTVFGIANRDSVRWAYIEIGTYNGLVEAIETSDRQLYPLDVEHKSRPLQTYNIGGPACVTLDTPFEKVDLPELEIGDRLYVGNTGAYTLDCASEFNGFPTPKVYYYNDLV